MQPIAVPAASFLLAVVIAILSGNPLRLLARQAAGNTCNDPVNLPICIRPVSVAGGAEGGTTMNFTPQVLADMQTGINAIWARCCISFTVTLGDPVVFPKKKLFNEKGKLIAASTDGQTVTMNPLLDKTMQDKNSKKCLNLYYVNDAKENGLKKGEDIKGIGYLGQNGMVVDDNVPPVVNAHELGHNLNLPHNNTPGNLMEETLKSNPGTGLNDIQCSDAKNRAQQYLAEFSR